MASILSLIKKRASLSVTKIHTGIFILDFTQLEHDLNSGDLWGIYLLDKKAELSQN